MKCKTCGQDNPPEARLCGDCGATLAPTVEPPSIAELGPPPEPPAVAAESGGFWSKYKWLITAFAVVTVVVVVLAWQAQPKFDGTATAPEVGALAPDFELQDLDGETVSLSNLRGSPVMLNFWASWCGPCRAEMPYIQQIYEDKEWQDKGLVILAIDKKETPSTVRQFMQSHNFSFPVLLDTNGNVAQKYNVSGIPATFFIDEDGIIQEWKLGSFSSKQQIEDCLSKIIMPTDTTPPPTTTTPPVEQATLPDSNLEAAVREALNKPQGPIYIGDLEPLTTLGAQERGISDLTGLEYCVNLVSLHLFGNNISDISPLAGLTNLNHLCLYQNNISDISPLAGLTNVEYLHLGGNNISDISPLAGLTNLKQLWLYQNNISDISPLAGLTNLRTLQLCHNNISDISPLDGLTNLRTLHLHHNNISDISLLAGLTNLEVLYLYNNNISDISPLVENSGLSAGDTVDLRNNPLSTTSVNVYIPQLEARGVDVEQ